MAKKEKKKKVKLSKEAKPKKEKKLKNNKSVEETLWDSANKLRGGVEPAEYKHVVLSLIFLKFASDKFEEQKQKLIEKKLGKYIDQVEFYTKDNVFYLPTEARWTYLKERSKQDDIAVKVDKAFEIIEKKNKSLKGALPINYFSTLGLETSKLSSLLDTINNIDTLKDKEQDVFGRVYEYFLRKFAIAEGKGKGEFYTPKSVVNLMASMIEPYSGIIYDPCCGSGGMFVQSIKFVESHKGNKKNIAIYGQESTNATYKLAKMNLAIRVREEAIHKLPGDRKTKTNAETKSGHRHGQGHKILFLLLYRKEALPLLQRGVLLKT